MQQSDDWQLRDHIDPAMLDAVHDLQRRCLDAIAHAEAHAPEAHAEVHA